MNLKFLKFVTTLRNLSLNRSTSLVFIHNAFIEEICSLFYKEGLIQSYNVLKDIKSQEIYLKVLLRTNEDMNPLTKIKVISVPSKVQYISCTNLKRLSLKKSILILSTNLGLMTSESCIKKNVGGVLILSC